MKVGCPCSATTSRTLMLAVLSRRSEAPESQYKSRSSYLRRCLALLFLQSSIVVAVGSVVDILVGFCVAGGAWSW